MPDGGKMRPAQPPGTQRGAGQGRPAAVQQALARTLLALCGVYGAVFGLAQGFALEMDVRRVAAFCAGVLWQCACLFPRVCALCAVACRRAACG